MTDIIIETFDMIRKGYSDHFRKDLYGNIHFKRSMLHTNIERRKNGNPDIGKMLYPCRWAKGKVTEDYLLGTSLGLALSENSVIIGPGMKSDLEEMVSSYGPSTVFHFGEDRYEINVDIMTASDIIEINYAERESARPIPEINESKDIIKLVQMLRELTGSRIAIRLNSFDLEKDIDRILACDVDLIIIDSIAPEKLKESIEHPIISTIIANRHMETFRSREKGVQLVVDAPFRTPTDIVKLMALGADRIGTTYLFRSLHDVNRSSEREMDWAEVGEVYGEILTNIEKEVDGVLEYLSGGSLHILRSNSLIAGDYGTASMTGLPLSGYGKTLPIWRH